MSTEWRPKGSEPVFCPRPSPCILEGACVGLEFYFLTKPLHNCTEKRTMRSSAGRRYWGVRDSGQPPVGSAFFSLVNRNVSVPSVVKARSAGTGKEQYRSSLAEGKRRTTFFRRPMFRLTGLSHRRLAGLRPEPFLPRQECRRGSRGQSLFLFLTA